MHPVVWQGNRKGGKFTCRWGWGFQGICGVYNYNNYRFNVPCDFTIH